MVEMKQLIKPSRKHCEFTVPRYRSSRPPGKTLTFASPLITVTVYDAPGSADCLSGVR